MRSGYERGAESSRQEETAATEWSSTAAPSSFSHPCNISSFSSISTAKPSSSSSSLPLSRSTRLNDQQLLIDLTSTETVTVGNLYLEGRQDWVERGVRRKLELVFGDNEEEPTYPLKQHGRSKTDQRASVDGAKLGTRLPPGLVSMHIAPFLHFDVPLKNQLYVMGGRNMDTEALASVEMFDTWHGVWTTCPPMSHNRTGCSASCLPSGKLLVVGGYDDRGIVSGLLCSCEIFDSTTQTWSDAPSLGRPRWGLSSATLNGRVYAVGGCSLRTGAAEDQRNMETLNLCEVYDEGSDAWELAAPLCTRRAGARLVNIGVHRLALVGGCEDVFGESRILQTVELFDDTTKCWTMLTTSLQAPRTTAAVAALPGKRGEIFVFGGAPARSTSEVYSVEAAILAQEIPPSTSGRGRKDRQLKKLHKVPPTLPVTAGRMGCQAVSLLLPSSPGNAKKGYPKCVRHSVIILGGECGDDWDGPTQELLEVPVYDMKTNKWRDSPVVPPMPTPRTALAACLADGRVRGYA